MRKLWMDEQGEPGGGWLMWVGIVAFVLLFMALFSLVFPQGGPV